MGFASSTQTIYGNSSATFDFSNTGETIGALVYGIQQIEIVNGTPGGQLQNFGLTYSISPGTGVGYSSVTLVQNVESGLDPSQSWAEVTVLVYLGGANPSGIYLSNQSISAGQTGATPVQPSQSQPPGTIAAVLGGFTLSFSSDDSDLLGLGAAAGVSCVPGGSQIVPMVSGVLIGDSAYSGTINAGLIAMDPNESGIAFQEVTSSSASQSLSCTFSGSVSNAAVFLQSFYAQFDIDTDPSPDLISLTAGSSSPSWQSSGGTSNVTSSLAITYKGETTHGGTYGPYNVPATVTDTQASYLVVALF